MEVKGIMVNDPICATPDMDIRQVANLLLENKLHAVPVVDENKKVAGIISESDFFEKGPTNLYLPLYIEMLQKMGISQEVTVEQEKKISHMLGATAKDIMTPNCMTVTPDVSFDSLLETFKTTHFKTLPVVDETHAIVGVVTLMDLVAKFDSVPE